ncbi:PQQ-binding-like beta-propeller repeat protein [Halorarius litoreus]|uniref:outer membrane protein assembly factor BamB family protein n=1 Tax=Halorarius litoreus TaxID=2962676 RepID=UPI0020CF2C7F|nr:PQQ-binding-like beta-propeller repeat protein [Halorarius litoreus]
MDGPLSRRAFLGAAGLATAGVTAGCSSTITGTAPPTETGAAAGADAAGSAPDVAQATFRGGLQRHGVYPEATIPESPAVEWTRRGLNTGDHTAAKASPVATPDGDLVVPSDAGIVQRYTPAGDLVWSKRITHAARGIHGTPTIVDDTVYIGAYDGVLSALDLATGARRWRANLGDAIGSSPGYHDGVVYIAVEYYEPSGAMFGLDAATGEVVWEDQRPTDHPHSTCAIDREAGRLVVGSNDGRLYAWSYPDLEFQWSFPTGDAIKGPIATYDGSAFFGSWSDSIYRVSLADGELEWAVETGGYVMSGPSIEPETETVYIGSHDSNLYALDVATGTEQWRFETDGWLIGCPTVTRDHVLVGSYDGFCYAVDKATGEETWRVAGVGRVTGTPLVLDGTVYFTDRASAEYLDDGSGQTGGLYKVVARE